MIELQQIAGIFSHYVEAVLAVHNGNIVYGNYAARKLMPVNFENMPVAQFLPKELTENTAERYAGTAAIGEKMVSVVVTPLDVYRIFTITTLEMSVQEADTDTMVDSIAFNIRSSLMTMRAASAYLMNHMEFIQNEKLHQYMAMLNHSSYMIARTTNHFVEFAVRQSLNSKPIYLDEMYDQLITEVTALIADRRIELVYTCKDKCLIYGDEYLLKRMLLELLSNSIKYTPSGGKIFVSITVKDDKVYITVKDTGCGIRPEILETVWNRFQVGRPLDDPRAGIGLGLTFVRRFARLHGGNVLLQSEVDKGTTVTVIIPKRSSEDSVLRSPIVWPVKPLNLWVELADVLNCEQYSNCYMD
jgi:signal transduction histidine kinase